MKNSASPFREKEFPVKFMLAATATTIDLPRVSEKLSPRNPPPPPR